VRALQNSPRVTALQSTVYLATFTKPQAIRSVSARTTSCPLHQQHGDVAKASARLQPLRPAFRSASRTKILDRRQNEAAFAWPLVLHVPLVVTTRRPSLWSIEISSPLCCCMQLCRSARPKLHASPAPYARQGRRVVGSVHHHSSDRGPSAASRWASLEDMQESKCWEWACCSSLAGLGFRSTVFPSIADECEESFGHLVGAVRHELGAMVWDPDSPKVSTLVPRRA
jgi:hypothetical protein